MTATPVPIGAGAERASATPAAIAPTATAGGEEKQKFSRLHDENIGAKAPKRHLRRA
jgi:hypothetical protein